MIEIDSTTQDRSLVHALQFLLDHENRKIEHLQSELVLSFANEQWRNTVYVGKDTGLIHRKHLEIRIFSCLASELRTGDLCVNGSENYANYRDQLLPWQECEPMVTDYCEVPSSATDFVHQLKQWLTETAETVDLNYPDNGQVLISEAGEPVLKRLVRKDPSPSSKELESAIVQRLPERNILDVLCNLEPRYRDQILNSNRKQNDISSLLLDMDAT